MSLAKSFVWMTLAEVLFNFSGYIVHSGAGRLMTPEDYGRYGLIVTLSIMIVTLVGNGVPISMSKYLSENYETKPELVPVIKRSGLKAQLILIAVIMGVFYLATPLLASLLRDDTLVRLFRISIFILPMYALDSFYFYYYTGIQQFNFQSVLKTVRSLLRIVLILGMIVLWKLEGAILGYIFVPFLVFLLAWSYDFIKITKRFPAISHPPSFDWKQMLGYAWPITLFTIFYEVLIALNLYFVKALLSDDYLTGIFNSALMIARIPYYLFYAMNIIIFPSVSRLFSLGEKGRVRELVAQFTRTMLLVLIPLATLMFAYCEELISFVFGAEYLVGAAVLAPLILALSFLTIFYFFSFALNGIGEARFSMWTALGGMFLNGALSAKLIPLWGIQGSAWALVASAFIILIIVLVQTRKKIGKVSDFSLLTTALFCAGIVFFLARFLPGKNGLFLLWGFILAGIFYGLLFLFGVLKKADWLLLRSMFGKKH